MTDLDVKVIPTEAPVPEPSFEKHELAKQVKDADMKDLDVTRMVKMKFPNFAKLVATHSFEDILMKNSEEDVIIPADLLADLANADLVDDEKRQRIILVLGGVVLGVLLAFLLFSGL